MLSFNLIRNLFASNAIHCLRRLEQQLLNDKTLQLKHNVFSFIVRTKRSKVSKENVAFSTRKCQKLSQRKIETFKPQHALFCPDKTKLVFY